MTESQTVSRLPVEVINREDEIRQVTIRLDNLINHVPIPDPVLFYYGVPRVGKTTLLREIKRIIGGPPRKVPTAFIDFDKEGIAPNSKPVDKRYDGDEGKVCLAADILTGLVYSTDTPAGLTIRHEGEKRDTPDTAARKLKEYVEWIRSFLKPPVFLFDTLEEAPTDTFTWCQEEILTPILESRQLLMVMAGWTDHYESGHRFIWPIVRRLYTHELRPFDLENSRKQIKTLDPESIWLQRKNLIELTGGLPGLNEELARSAELGQTVAEREKSILNDMVELVFQRLVKGEEDLRKELLVIAILRQFDIRLLQHILGKMWPQGYQDLGIYEARQLLRQLRQTMLVKQHPDGYGYGIPHDIRRVLDEHQRHHQPERYFQVHYIAFVWFHQQVEQGDVSMVANQIYHLAALWRDAQARQVEMPDALPDGHDRMAQLQQQLLTGLTSIKDDGRAYELVEKLGRVIQREEFYWFLYESEIKELTTLCQEKLKEYAGE